MSGGRRDPNAADFLWLLLPLALLAASRKGAAPAGLAVGFALYVVGPLLGGLIMLAKGRSSGPDCWSPHSSPSSGCSPSSASRTTGGSARHAAPARDESLER